MQIIKHTGQVDNIHAPYSVRSWV